jgi:Cleft lip and palate transmembrane protein 1 (CLPTM1)
MADAGGVVAAAGAADGGEPQQQQQGGIMSMLGGIVRMMVMMSLVKYMFGGGSGSAPVNSKGRVMPPHTNVWPDGQKFDMAVYVSETYDFFDFDNEDKLVWSENNLVYGQLESNNRYKNVSIPATPRMQQNGSVYAHVYLTQIGKSPDPSTKNFRRLATVYKRHMINTYRPKPKVHARKNLLSGEYADDRIEEDDTHEDIIAKQAAPQEIVSFWRPKFALRLLHDFTSFPYGQLPAPLASFYELHERGNQHGYFPVVYPSYFWTLKEEYIQMNSTVTEVPLEMSLEMISMMAFQFQVQMEESWKQQAQFGGNEGDTEEFKRMLMDTNPYLLAITFGVSMLHMVFDFLAFKNDIAFWKNNKSMEGLSVRTIFMNSFFQVVIFLYLLDNDTSWMILLSSGVGLIIEFWKVFKAADITFKPSWPFIVVKNKNSYEKSMTAQYDAQAMQYLSWVLYPLVIGYSIYSLKYEEHKSWYSWALGSLVGCVYTFGFIMMCPQLYLNYKLKSVAHLPWRMLTYKALNTFIDDLFAFIIKMPTLHRLSCFRDDIVFFIYLYQRWIYRTDFSRANEFGLVPVKEGEEGEDTQGKENASDKKENAQIEEILDAAESESVATEQSDTTQASQVSEPASVNTDTDNKASVVDDDDDDDDDDVDSIATELSDDFDVVNAEDAIPSEEADSDSDSVTSRPKRSSSKKLRKRHNRRA